MKTTIVGEIGINHNGSLETALKLIDVASDMGFDYVKFQKRSPQHCVPDSQKDVIRKTPWGDMKYIEYRERMEFGLAEYLYIKEYCEDKNIGWFASAWDVPSAMFLHDFGCEIIKIPSAKLTDNSLLRFCSSHFENRILSTGMSTEAEIWNAYKIINPTVIMHSISIYPTRIEDSRLKYITWLKDHFVCDAIGYSGHEQGVDLSIAAMVCGATWIERHITLDKKLWGSDHTVSIEPKEMEVMVKRIRQMEKIFDDGYAPRKLLGEEKIKRRQLRGE